MTHTDYHVRLHPDGAGYRAEIKQTAGCPDIIGLGAHGSGQGRNPAAAILAAVVDAKLGRPVAVEGDHGH